MCCMEYDPDSARMLLYFIRYRFIMIVVYYTIGHCVYIVRLYISGVGADYLQPSKREIHTTDIGIKQTLQTNLEEAKDHKVEWRFAVTSNESQTAHIVNEATCLSEIQRKVC